MVRAGHAAVGLQLELQLGVVVAERHGVAAAAALLDREGLVARLVHQHQPGLCQLAAPDPEVERQRLPLQGELAAPVAGQCARQFLRARAGGRRGARQQGREQPAPEHPAGLSPRGG
ncbi:hypothetical protein H1235_15375 [Pseudoxanthomonas sp. NC8]|nr:hypothetical protein H1235_15375 [Pseudoxanthomonas sp. NC8]